MIRLIFLLLALALPGIGAAANCELQADNCDEGQAYQAVVSRVNTIYSTNSVYNKDKKINPPNAPSSDGWGSVSGAACGSKGCGGSSQIVRAVYKGRCSARPSETGWKSQEGGGSKVCHNGCAYTSALEAGTPNGFSFDPTGNVCQDGEHPAPEADSGGDTGGGGSGEIGNPGDGGSGGGGGNGGGNSGGGNGGGGNGNGDGEGDGEGDGDGDGDGDGGSPGGGGGGGGGGGDDAGGVTNPDGELYKKSDKKMEDVMRNFRTKAMETKMVKGVTDFMRVPGGGSCPVFTVAASKWWQSMTINFHCSGTFLALLQACGYVIFAIALYAAVRIALT